MKLSENVFKRALYAVRRRLPLRWGSVIAAHKSLKQSPDGSLYTGEREISCAALQGWKDGWTAPSALGRLLGCCADGSLYTGEAFRTLRGRLPLHKGALVGCCAGGSHSHKGALWGVALTQSINKPCVCGVFDLRFGSGCGMCGRIIRTTQRSSLEP